MEDDRHTLQLVTDQNSLEVLARRLESEDAARNADPEHVWNPEEFKYLPHGEEVQHCMSVTHQAVEAMLPGLERMIDRALLPKIQALEAAARPKKRR